MNTLTSAELTTITNLINREELTTITNLINRELKVQIDRSNTLTNTHKINVAVDTAHDLLEALHAVEDMVYSADRT